MLVLTRKVGEKIAIGGKQEIVVTVVAIGGGRVRLGVEAEASIPVHRVVNRNECSRPSLISE